GDPLHVVVAHLRGRVHGVGDLGIVPAADVVQAVAGAAGAGVLGIVERRRAAAIQVEFAVVDVAADEKCAGHGARVLRVVWPASSPAARWRAMKAACPGESVASRYSTWQCPQKKARPSARPSCVRYSRRSPQSGHWVCWCTW